MLTWKVQVIWPFREGTHVHGGIRGHPPLLLIVPFVQLKNIYDCPFILLHTTIKVCFFHGSMILTSPWCIFSSYFRTTANETKESSYISRKHQRYVINRYRLAAARLSRRDGPPGAASARRYPGIRASPPPLQLKARLCLLLSYSLTQISVVSQIPP